jgi:hypothetical protein
MKFHFPLIVFFVVQLHAQEYSYYPRHRSVSMQGLEYIRINPASIPSDRFSMLVGGIQRFQIDDYLISAIDLSARLSSFDGMAISISGIYLPDFTNQHFQLIYNRKLTPNLIIGGGLGGDFKNNSQLYFGLIYKLPEYHITYGSSLVVEADNFKIRWGIEYWLLKELSVFINMTKSTDRNFQNEFGIHYHVSDSVRLIGGIQPNSYEVYLSAGYLFFEQMEVVFNLSHHAYLGQSPSFSLIYRNTK